MLRALAIPLLLASPLAAQDFFTLKGHGGPIMDITVSPAGQIATASFDNSVGLWIDRSPAWLEGHRAAVNTVAFVKDDVLGSAGDDNSLRLWSIARQKTYQIDGHTAKIVDIAVAPNGDTIATASWDATVGLSSWSQIQTSADTVALTTNRLKGHKQGVNALAFSQDGQRLYSASVDGTIREWSFLDPAPVSRVIVKHGFGVNELVVNDTDGWLAYGAADGGTRLIDLETGAQIADFSMDRRPILSMTYDPQAHRLAVGDGHGYIMMIDTQALQITHDFRATTRGPIWALAFSTDGRNIHSGGIEDIVYSWPVATLDEHGTMSPQTRSFLEDPDALPNGERQFKRKCSICHTLSEGSARRAGPSLHNLFGRRAGTVPDYTYSETLYNSEIIWSSDTINALFDEGPDHYIPGTKMPMQRITQQGDRDDLITYLRHATQTQEN
ncbi:MAG: c-type cytochrome [Paracoccaceae bacterium]